LDASNDLATENALLRRENDSLKQQCNNLKAALAALNCKYTNYYLNSRNTVKAVPYLQTGLPVVVYLIRNTSAADTNATELDMFLIPMFQVFRLLSPI
jgi:hypothetical protein